MSAPETALATAAPAGLALELSIEKALKLVEQAKELHEVRDARDVAQALTTLARSRDASREVQNGAAEVTLRATRKMGEILDAQKAEGKRAKGGVENLRKGTPAPAAHEESPGKPTPAPARPPTLEELGIDHNLATRAQKLARMPAEKLETYVRAQKENPNGEITLAGALQVAASKNPHAASHVNDGDPEKNVRFTPSALVRRLHRRFRYTVDAFGHPESPATKIIGRCFTVAEDGFAQDYTDERGFANPEWDVMPEVIWLVHQQMERGCSHFTVLGPTTKTEQEFHDQWIEPYRYDRGGSGVRVEFLRERVHYGKPWDPECEDPANRNVGMPSMLVIFEGERRRSREKDEDGNLVFPELVDCACGHQHSEGRPCPICPECKKGNDGAEAQGEGEARAKVCELGWSQFLDEVAKLPSLSGQLGKTKGQSCVAVRCDAWPEKPKGWRCTKTWRFPLNAAGLLARADLQEVRQHARGAHEHREQQQKPSKAKRGGKR